MATGKVDSSIRNIEFISDYVTGTTTGKAVLDISNHRFIGCCFVESPHSNKVMINPSFISTDLFKDSYKVEARVGSALARITYVSDTRVNCTLQNEGTYDMIVLGIK